MGMSANKVYTVNPSKVIICVSNISINVFNHYAIHVDYHYRRLLFQMSCMHFMVLYASIAFLQLVVTNNRKPRHKPAGYARAPGWLCHCSVWIRHSHFCQLINRQLCRISNQQTEPLGIAGLFKSTVIVVVISLPSFRKSSCSPSPSFVY